MGIVDSAVDAVVSNPTLSAIVVTLLALVFGGYFFLRRIVVDARRGYREGREQR
ncbi:MAG: hypothetical protein ABEI75_04405 [Halobaculum sp.]